MSVAEVELPSDKKFGWFFCGIFGVSAGYCAVEEMLLWAIFFVSLAAIFGFVVNLRPSLLFPLNKLWMRIGLFLGMIFTPVVLAVIFFGLITPVAIFFKVIGRDELRLKFEKNESYWRDKDESASLSSFENQF
jgi:hypothetical protein